MPRPALNSRVCLHLLFVLVAAASVGYLLPWDGQRNTKPAIRVNNIRWGANIQEETEALTRLGLKMREGHGRYDVWENENVSVMVLDERIVGIYGDSLFVNNAAVLKKGRSADTFPVDLIAAFQSFGQKEGHFYGITAAESGERSLVTCYVSGNEFVEFSQIPFPNSPKSREGYPDSLFQDDLIDDATTKN